MDSIRNKNKNKSRDRGKKMTVKEIETILGVVMETIVYMDENPDKRLRYLENNRHRALVLGEGSGFPVMEIEHAFLMARSRVESDGVQW